MFADLFNGGRGQESAAASASQTTARLSQAVRTVPVETGEGGTRSSLGGLNGPKRKLQTKQVNFKLDDDK